MDVSSQAITAREFIKQVGRLAPRRQGDSTPLHRPLLLLWLLGRAASGAPRLVYWREVWPAFEKLAANYGNGADDGAAVYPFWVLHANNRLWEIERSEHLVFTSGGRRPTRASLDVVNPAAGFPQSTYDLLVANPEVIAQAAANLLVRYFNPIPDGLLADLGLRHLVAGNEVEALTPIPGVDIYRDRTAIYEAHGGQRYAGIGPLEDGLPCVFSDEKGPYNDRHIPGTSLIEYRGDGLIGDQHLKGGNATLAECQRQQIAIRYWHKPHGEPWRFQTWAVVVDRRYVWGKGTDKKWRREYAWILAPVESPFRDTWALEVRELLDDDDGETHDDTTGTEAPAADNPNDARHRYQAFCNSVESREHRNRGRSTRQRSERYFRSAQARLAVLLRAVGRCENPECTGQPEDVTDKGDPILEVDHVDELAKGGRDHPKSMIALCPNCHAIKTRGKTRHSLQRKLKAEALRRHVAWSGARSAESDNTAALF
ncbi:HNH endonuclease signature motif containing protein [Microbispora sp. H10949]|uniref:HNH endonuclease signature motif containing protein n=1 Tax=Microbispora sp. H10949 TaxID=2729111 RepID=UPI0016000043|nr:HNH endonuclease signature motif containing protein [Microbispora sp. H10949]